jgi:RNA polymerase sigma-70 factor (ECF subfamily)
MKNTFLSSNSIKEHSFKLFYKKYYAPFCLYTKRFIDNKEVREDIVSSVFALLWEMLDTFDLNSNTALGYVKMCIKNNCLNYLKHQGICRNYEEKIQLKTPIYETEPDSVYTLDELYQMLNDILNELPEKYRTVLIESFFEGKTHAKIAEEMSVSVKSVNRYKKKAIEILRNEMKDLENRKKVRLRCPSLVV